MLELRPNVYEEFFATNRDNYRKLFEIYGMDWPGDDFVRLYDATRPVWVAPEFGLPLPGGYTDDQHREALPVLVAMGLFDSHKPPADGIPKVFYNTGRKYPGMYAGWAGLDETLALGPVAHGIGAFGSRAYKPENDGEIEQLILQGETADVIDVPWVQRMFERPAELLTEFDLGIYSALCYYGPDAVRLPNADGPSGGQSYMLAMIRGVPFVIVGAPPTERHGDYYRPKARTAADEAMNVIPFRGDEIFVVNGGPPHLRVCAAAMDGIRRHYPNATGYAVIRRAEVLDQDPLRAARLGTHEAALWISSTAQVRRVAAERKAAAGK